jgi:hypothetical protein
MDLLPVDSHVLVSSFDNSAGVHLVSAFHTRANPICPYLPDTLNPARHISKSFKHASCDHFQLDGRYLHLRTLHLKSLASDQQILSVMSASEKSTPQKSPPGAQVFTNRQAASDARANLLSIKAALSRLHLLQRASVKSELVKTTSLKPQFTNSQPVVTHSKKTTSSRLAPCARRPDKVDEVNVAPRQVRLR